MKSCNILEFWLLLLSAIIICTAVDTIGANQTIGDGETLVSAGGTFELGFFSPGDSKNWYVGIWYKKNPKKTVVWVANREKPLNDTSAVLKVTENGVLVLSSSQDGKIWSSNSPRSSKNPVAQLLDSGNLVVKDTSEDNTENFLWQSFDHPCHTLLPDMKLGVNKLKGHEWSLTSWKSDDDPAQGDYERRIDPTGYPQSIITQSMVMKSRLGPWNGLGFSGHTVYKPNPYIDFDFFVSQEEIFFRYELISTVLSRLVLNPHGVVERYILINRTGEWQKYTNSETDNCDSYKICGAYGSCNISNNPICKCLEGFEPKNPEQWRMADWSTGCVRKAPLNCKERDVFITHPSVKLPDTRTSWYNQSMSLEECKTMCSKNCSCTAYANMDVRDGGTGCFLWFGDLVDTKESSTNAQDLHIRVAGIPLCGACNTFCGAYGKCNINKGCDCLDGFKPKNPKAWEMADWSNGCVRKTQLDCGGKCDYLTQRNIQPPDTLNASYIDNISLAECKSACFKNSSCTAYVYRDAEDGGPGCFLWFSDLIGIGDCTTNGRNLYVKLDSSTAPSSPVKLWKKLVPAFVAAFLVLSVGLSVIVWKKKTKRELRLGRSATSLQPNTTNENWTEDSDLKLFDFITIANATNTFSDNNKIGEGGFGPVYKGVLEDGKDIAVKKLARNSAQGNDEFRNEVMYIAKLQHRNLVTLLGYCLHEEEKMLIYEFHQNKSLDLFIFDPNHGMVLDWQKRLYIIKGIARGLLYLHQDSKLRIIHRDLKAGNILLDSRMNPKISDFGIARSFIEQDSEGQTNRMVGTHGYVSPEYVSHGQFSVKSDVFSYGVLVLEIVSGKMNGRFHHPEHRLNLIGHAWKLFQEERQMELIDLSIQAASDWTEVFRAIHIGLLCVQHRPEDRPNMASVVHMLEGESALRQPEQPGFYNERNMLLLSEASLGETSSLQPSKYEINMVTITQVEGR